MGARCLPAKFGFLVDGGGSLRLLTARSERARSRAAGMRARPGSPRSCAARDGDRSVRADIASMSAKSCGCRWTAAPIRPRSADEAAPAILRLRTRSVALAGEASGGCARSWRRGERRRCPTQPALNIAPHRRADGLRRSRSAFSPTAGAFGAGLPFGGIEPRRCWRPSPITARYGDGMLRLTPWRAVLLAGARTAGRGRAARRGAPSSASSSIRSDPAPARRRLFRPARLRARPAVSCAGAALAAFAALRRARHRSCLGLRQGLRPSRAGRR